MAEKPPKPPKFQCSDCEEVHVCMICALLMVCKVNANVDPEEIIVTTVMTMLRHPPYACDRHVAVLTGIEKDMEDGECQETRH